LDVLRGFRFGLGIGDLEIVEVSKESPNCKSEFLVAAKIDELGQLKGDRERRLVGAMVMRKGKIVVIDPPDLLGDFDFLVNKMSNGPRGGRFDEVMSAPDEGLIEGLDVFFFRGSDEEAFVFGAGLFLLFVVDEVTLFVGLRVVEGSESELFDIDFVGDVIGEPRLIAGAMEGELDGLLGDLLVNEGVVRVTFEFSGVKVEIFMERSVGPVGPEELTVPMTYVVAVAERIWGLYEKR
jgi:hypothetical protein